MVNMDDSDWSLTDEGELDDFPSVIRSAESAAAAAAGRNTTARNQDEPSGSGSFRQQRSSQSSQRLPPAGARRSAEAVEVEEIPESGGRYSQVALPGERVLIGRRDADTADASGRVSRLRRGAANRDRTWSTYAEPVVPAERYPFDAADDEGRDVPLTRSSVPASRNSRPAAPTARNTRSRRGVPQGSSLPQPRYVLTPVTQPVPHVEVEVLEAEEIESVDDIEGNAEAHWDPQPRRAVRQGARSARPRPRSTRASSRLGALLGDEQREIISDDSDSTLNDTEAVVAEMAAIFSDEATISDDDELTFDEEDDDFFPTIRASRLRGLRVIVEALSNQEMAQRSIEISSDEDNEEQRREWRRRGVETANARRRSAAGGSSTRDDTTLAPSVVASTQATTRGNTRGVSQQQNSDNGEGGGSSTSNNDNHKEDEFSQGPSKRSRLEPDVARAPVPEPEEDANKVATCSICLDDMNQGGDHRLIVLKCGHCFGESCAKRWLMSGKRYCPMCNRQTSLKHMRVAFLDCHRLGESYELAEARKELDELRHHERQSSDRVRELNFRVKALVGQNALLSERVRQLEKGAHLGHLYLGQGSNDLSGFPKTQCFTKLSGQCKYMAYSDKLGLIAVSSKPATQFFGGFSVELCSLYDLKSRRAKLLHSQEIKDLDFHQSKQWLLTASLDNSARISSVENLGLTNVHTLQLSNKVWSACWSNASDTNFYLGLSNGDVCEYDVRSLREEIQVLRGPSSNIMTPIVSLKSITVNQGGREIHGLACSQLRNVVRIFTEIGPNRYRAQDIPTAGNCFSLSYYAPNETLLVNSRTFGGQALNGVTNEVFSIEGRDGEAVVSAKCKFQSGGCSPVITKPAIVTSPSGELWACCLDDQAKTIQVFSCDDASLKLTLKSQDPLAKQFTQAERISLRGRYDYALAGLSECGLTIFA